MSSLTPTVPGVHNNRIDRNQLSLARNDSSSGSESDKDQANVGNHQFIPIDARVYKILVEGTKDALSAIEINLEELKSKEEENSVLHIAASAGQAHLITELLPMSKDIIKWTNNKGDLAFHSAAKASQYDSLKALMNWGDYDSNQENINKELLGVQNDEGDTPLHIALENNQENIARLLIDEFREACYVLNENNVSPLYMAIKSKFWDLAKRMISYTKQHKEASEPLLLKGKSLLHAAIDANNKEIMEEILTHHQDLIKSVDDEGQSPLSYAAFKCHIEGVQYLLEKFPDYAYECDNAGSFPIHKAASGGNVKVIKKLHFTQNLLNRKGQSILHVAAENGKSSVVSYVINKAELERLINLKDEDGNTPLHLAAKGFHPRTVHILTKKKHCKTDLQNKNGLTALDFIEVHAESLPTFEARLTWMALRYVDAPRSSQSKRKSYVRKLRSGKQKNKANEAKELDSFTGRVDTHMLVATLIATVTFAAGFTLPGGYNQSDKDPNIGMAVLAKKWAFKIFVICNTAALYSSILSVVTLIWAHLGDLKLILLSLNFALPMLGFALVMMSMSFMMGIFVVLKTVSWLSYLILGMGSVFLLGVLLFFIPLYNPSYIKNSVVRFFFSGTFLLLLLVCEKSSITYT